MTARLLTMGDVRPHCGGSQEGTGVRRKLILQRDDSLRSCGVFPDYATFDRIVAENGAVLYRPSSKDWKVLAAAPPPEFVDELRRRGVQPLAVGRCIVATWHPFETVVLEVIREQGLELQVIF